MYRSLSSLSLLILGLICYSHQISAQTYQNYIGAGNSQGIKVSSSITEPGFSAMATLDGSGVDSAFMLVQAARFLEQATLGANRYLIDDVAEMGFDAWIDHEINKDPTYLQPLMEEVFATFASWCEDFQANSPEEKEEACEQLAGEWAFKFTYSWFQAALTSEDYLRQRVAFALSEILVISGQSVSDQEYANIIANYYDVLVKHAFGNYEDLLLEVTLHPAMGAFLSHFNNPRTIPQENIRPDENYAREIMQLFTIGLEELNQDGTPKLDENQQVIPTYNNQDIKEFAKVFTGLGDGGAEGKFGTPPFEFLVDFFQPMRMYEEWHEPGEKNLLNDFVVPAGQTGMQDIEMAVKHLFEHPNVGPFIGRRLIQRLVKSNPTPDYVRRVAAVFADNGKGERGDLGAVVKAILLDPEARDCEWIDQETSGKLREPILRYTHTLRSLNAFNETERYWNTGYYFNMEARQLPMFAPSVFNFYLPDYQPNGPIADADLFGPEFQIHNSNTSIGYFNLANAWMFWEYLMDNGYEYEIVRQERPDTERVRIDYTQWEDIENPDVLIDELGLLLCASKLSDGTKQIIRDAIIPLAGFPPYQVRMTIYLILLSPDYNVTR